MIKRLILFLLSLAIVASCYDDSAIWDKLHNLEERIARWEEMCKEMNSNIAALEDIVSALQSNDYVTGVKDITEQDEKVGYTITFSKSGNINIYLRATGTVWRCLLPLVDRQPEVRLWNLTMKEVMPMNAYEIVDLILISFRKFVINHRESN